MSQASTHETSTDRQNKRMPSALLSLRVGAALILIFGAAAMRLVPHPPNFTPIAGLALFGAAIFKRRELGLVFPLIALFLSDCVLGFHNQMIAVYVSFLLISGIGMFLRGVRRPSRLVLASLVSSVLFFLVTNTAVWFAGSAYSHSFSGLMLCLAAGLPFFENTALGDLVSTGALFGLWAMLGATFENISPATKSQTSNSAAAPHLI